MRIAVGDRIFERDRGGDALPRGGIVIRVLDASEQVLVASRWSPPPKASKANRMPFVDVHLLDVEALNPETLAPTSSSERVKLARAIAGVISARSSGACTDADVRDLDDVRVLLDVAGRYAAGMNAELERARPVVDPRSGELIKDGVGPVAVARVTEWTDHYVDALEQRLAPDQFDAAVADANAAHAAAVDRDVDALFPVEDR